MDLFMEVAPASVDFSSLVTAITTVIPTSLILGLMGTIVTATAGIAFVKFGGAKIVSSLWAAVTKGKIKS